MRVGTGCAAGQCHDAVHDGVRYGMVDYFSVGVNARFNLGYNNPLQTVLAGCWAVDIGEFDEPR